MIQSAKKHLRVWLPRNVLSTGYVGRRCGFDASCELNVLSLDLPPLVAAAAYCRCRCTLSVAAGLRKWADRPSAQGQLARFSVRSLTGLAALLAGSEPSGTAG